MKKKSIMPLKYNPEGNRELVHDLGVTIEIHINVILCRNSILTYLGNPGYRRNIFRITKYGTIEVTQYSKKRI